MIPDPSPPYEFEPSEAMRERIRNLIDRAGKLGHRAAAIQAFAKIFDYLTRAPRDWGDPIRKYKKMKLTEYHGRHWNLRCVYSVHDRVPIVFLTKVIPLPGNPLFGKDLG